MVQAGQIDEVARYCESDVLNTYRVWLVYELFRGSITRQELDWSEVQTRDFVASRKSTNPLLSKSVGRASFFSVRGSNDVGNSTPELHRNFARGGWALFFLVKKIQVPVRVRHADA
jgi:Predicted 3'-5' exonuclease related to the exonuclease domain of PolB